MIATRPLTDKGFGSVGRAADAMKSTLVDSVAGSLRPRRVDALAARAAAVPSMGGLGACLHLPSSAGGPPTACQVSVVAVSSRIWQMSAP